MNHCDKFVAARRKCISMMFALLTVCGSLLAQVNENCTVAVLNRTVQVKSDGTWVLPNIPANFGLVRARATCVENGVTRSGESAPFALSANGSVDVPPITLGSTTPIPTQITITGPAQLTQSNRTGQLTVTAHYASGPDRIITNATTGTAYNISNTQIATITPNGLVTAVRSGTVLVQAVNEGTQGLFSISVVLTGDSDGDGIPDDVEIREGLNPNDPSDALTDLDNDGLNNRDEIARGTQLRDPDSDDDTIRDGEEVVAGADGFVTNPLLADTDGDGFRDALEILSGTDPTIPNIVIPPGALTGIEVTPSSFTLIVNTIIPQAYTQLNVLGRLRDNTTIDLTARAGTNYSSSNLNICNFGAPPGRVFAGSDGACVITVTHSGSSATANGVVRSFAPTPVSFLPNVPGFANSVQVQGDYAYIAAGAAGLHVVDISNKQNPRIVGTRDTPGNANDVRVAGDYAYVADGSSGLQIINVSNPANPVIVGASDTPGDARDIAIGSNLAFIADGPGGLQVVSIANPTAPIPAGALAVGSAEGVAFDSGRNILALALGSAGLRLVNVATPSNPQALGSANTGGEARDVEFAGNFAMVAAMNASLVSVDTTNTVTPVVRGSTPSATGGVLTGLVVTRGFALGADSQFGNRATIIDVSTPETPAPRALITFDSSRNDRPTNIAADVAFAYVTSVAGGGNNGSTGDSRLYIGQFISLEDTAGVPPQVSLTTPAPNSLHYHGEQLTLTAQASDDIAVAAVTFYIGGQAVFTDTSEPFDYSFTIPSNVSTLAFRAQALDLGGNTGQSPQISIQVQPDPLTRVTGTVVNEQGQPVSGAALRVNGDLTGMTGPNGTFTIAGVPTVRGDIVVNATFTPSSGIPLSGSSNPVSPVRGGTTAVGTITMISARFETDYGTFWTGQDDTFTERTLPFPFSFYGTSRTNAFVGSNGYITFNSGDSTYSESVTGFARFPRISAFFDDLIGGGGVHINAALPGRFIVTYDRSRHFIQGGSNTLQIILFQDGRIQFGYQGITALRTGSITGLTPGPNTPFEQVDFSATTALTIPANTSVYEYFTTTNPFDLDGGFVIFTPQPGGGYNVRTIRTPPPSIQSLISGGSSTSPQSASASAQLALTPAQLANAEVEIRSSLDPKFRGMTNTNSRGVFSLNGVPRGAIQVTVRRKGQLIGTGGSVLDVVQPSPRRELNVEIGAPNPNTKPTGR